MKNYLKYLVVIGIITLIISCKKKVDYESFMIQGKCKDWFSKAPIEGIKVSLYAGYPSGMFLKGKSELVGEYITDKDGNFKIMPQKSSYFRSNENSYLEVRVASSDVYYNFDSSYFFYSKNIPVDFKETLNQEILFGKYSVLKLIVNTGNTINDETLYRFQVFNNNPLMLWRSNVLVTSNPVMLLEDFDNTRMFKGVVNNGYAIYKVLANDTCFISGIEKKFPSSSWEFVSMTRVFCPEGDTTVLYYSY